MRWHTIWKLMRHYSAAIEMRSALLEELSIARRSGRHLPAGLSWAVWRAPHVHEEYIWLLRFVDNTKRVTLVDIGGNSGYWAERFLAYYPDCDIYAFEPIPEMYTAYTNRLSDYKRKAIFNVALGEDESKAIFNVSEDFVHSSFHRYDAPLKDKNAYFARTIELPVKPLDAFRNDIKGDPLIVKIDVQGFEGHVVKGGMEVLKRASALILECSFIQEYEGQLPTFIEAAAKLREVDLHPVHFGFFERVRGPMAYERNVLFVKESLLDRALDLPAE